jgi:hypothetical protein
VTSYAEALHDTEGSDVALMPDGSEGARLLPGQLLRLSLLVRTGGFFALNFGPDDLLPDLPILLTPSPDHCVFDDVSISFAIAKTVENLLQSFGLRTTVSGIRPLAPLAADVQPGGSGSIHPRVPEARGRRRAAAQAPARAGG